MGAYVIGDKGYCNVYLLGSLEDCLMQHHPWIRHRKKRLMNQSLQKSTGILYIENGSQRNKQR